MESFDLGIDLGIPESQETAEQESEKRAVIFIDQEENKPNYEFVGVNGKGYQIKRGVEVVVPLSVVGVLNNAVATRTVTDADGRPSGFQDFHAIPFRVIRYL